MEKGGLPCIFALCASLAWCPAGYGDAGGSVEPVSLTEAVVSALEHHPSILVAKQDSRIREAVLQQERGAFDTTLTYEGYLSETDKELAASSAGEAGVIQRSSERGFALGVTRPLRLGADLSLSASVDQTDTSLSSDTEDADPVNTSDIRLGLTVPLLRGRGPGAVQANEQAARSRSLAQLHATRYEASSIVRDAASRFWAFEEARKRQDILDASAARTEGILEDIMSLVEGDEVPQADLLQIRANLANKRRAALQQRLELDTSRKALVLAMGLDQEEPGFSITVSEENYPQPDQLVRVSELSSDELVDAALASRGDVAAQVLEVEAQQHELTQAHRELAPSLDLSLSAGYTGLDESDSGYVDALTENLEGLNGVIKLQGDLPFANNRLKGSFLQRAASLERARLQLRSMERRIRSEVELSVIGVEAALGIWEQTRIAREQYKEALESERKKYLMSVVTLLDVIRTEESLTSAELSFEASRRGLAQAVAELRHAAGLLVFTDAGGGLRVDPGDLVMLPAIPGDKALTEAEN